VKQTTRFLVLLSLLMLMSLAACERPAPGSEAPPPTATIGVPPLGAPTLPPVFPSPTPTAIPIDPNAPVGASPTPTVDPLAQPTTPPPAPQATAVPVDQTTSSGEIIHIVQPGENLYRIGLRYGFTYQELAAYNGIANPDSLSVGQQIRIPPR
jgi:hypothetical protein